MNGICNSWWRAHERARLIRGAWWGALAAAVLVLAGCDDTASSSGDDRQAQESSAASPRHESPRESQSPSSQSPEQEAKDAAVEAYEQMWADMAQAAETSDWRASYLPDHATGDVLQTITGSLYADHRNGVVTRGEPVLHPTVTSAEPSQDPTTVMIEDCGDSTNWLKYEEGTDQLVDDEPGGRQAIEAEVKRQDDGEWRVTRFGVWEVGSC